jgi:hypothetical protein
VLLRQICATCDRIGISGFSRALAKCHRDDARLWLGGPLDAFQPRRGPVAEARMKLLHHTSAARVRLGDEIGDGRLIRSRRESWVLSLDGRSAEFTMFADKPGEKRSAEASASDEQEPRTSSRVRHSRWRGAAANIEASLRPSRWRSVSAAHQSPRTAAADEVTCQVPAQQKSN